MAFVRFIIFCVDSINDFLRKNCPYIAGAVAFYTLFSLFPLFLAMISILGFVLGPEAEQEDIVRRLAEVLPVSSDYIGQTLSGVVSARTITGIASVLGLFAAATAAFGAIRKGINAAWGIRRTRPFIKERLIDFVLVLGAGVLMIAMLFSAPALGILRQVIFQIAPETEYLTQFVWNMIPNLFFPTLAFVTFLALYRYLPNTDVNLRDVWPGALMASVAFTAANLALVWYVSTFPLAYNVVYGSVGAIMALLTWAYLSAIILLFGALITARYAQYTASLGSRKRDPKVLWTGFTRVRVRIVEPSRAY